MHQDIKIIDFEIFYNFTVYESDNIDIKRKQWNCHHARNNGTVTIQETMHYKSDNLSFYFTLFSYSIIR